MQHNNKTLAFNDPCPKPVYLRSSRPDIQKTWWTSFAERRPALYIDILLVYSCFLGNDFEGIDVFNHLPGAKW
jgi:hypothetical protein